MAVVEMSRKQVAEETEANDVDVMPDSDYGEALLEITNRIHAAGNLDEM